MTDKLILPSTSEEQSNVSTTGYEYSIGPKQSLPNEANSPYIPSKLYSESLVYKKQQVALSSMAFLFKEMISQIYNNSKSSSEFESKLLNYGSSIGLRLLELLNIRASVPSNTYSRSSTFLSSNASNPSSSNNVNSISNTSNPNSTNLNDISNATNVGINSSTNINDKNYESSESLASLVSHMRCRDLKIIDILQFMHGTVWTYLFGSPSNDLVKSSERENEYMIVDHEHMLTQFISNNNSCDYFVCGIIQGFLTKADFPCTVTPHSNNENGIDGGVIYLIKFDKQVLERENLRYGS
ncbi:hypothetical protein Kpol_1018p61 [Vanderwaltozyma polyspora DSM 70294]|uniref:Trafficking protein particle complex subunit n=1 Tax=Vanderwaltozyma polyspora (strain ATCC 22028 / DSM 70294 / BCRC 21397 / CBS 2163 / NBRC 10782 / NRRL Y-8283 / UCD 57-17) TaxID=436907 RepID=A7TDQ9_VANPO|nr:uncharacterized protein Kpol_1018p61 [Vanderwaltozyma polyspora DSM 70294]EDO19529.1 hypothetical protein Kpol_1018p61 [Vanderwaltozyma polyspora DSM 70294]